MKNKKITTDTIGDVNQYPVLYSLVDILNDNEYKYTIKCITLLTEYRILLKELYKIDDSSKYKYLLQLLFKDIKCRLNTMRNFGIPNVIYTHMKNIICAMYRNELIKN